MGSILGGDFGVGKPFIPVKITKVRNKEGKKGSEYSFTEKGGCENVLSKSLDIVKGVKEYREQKGRSRSKWKVCIQQVQRALSFWALFLAQGGKEGHLADGGVGGGREKGLGLGSLDDAWRGNL